MRHWVSGPTCRFTAASHAYNRSGDLVETVTPAGQVTGYGYDLLGRPTSTQIGST